MANVSVSYPLKTPENQRFAVFSGYKTVISARSRLSVDIAKFGRCVDLEREIKFVRNSQGDKVVQCSSSKLKVTKFQRDLEILVQIIPANKHLFIVNNKDTRTIYLY